MKKMRYQSINGHFFTKNQPYCCNRPIFCANTNCTFLVGDQPFLRLVKDRNLLGSLQFWISVKERPLYFHDFSSIQFEYGANFAQWELSDSRVEGKIVLYAAVPEKTEGFLVKIKPSRPMEVYWQFGGLTYIPGQWNLSPMMHKELLYPEWKTENCKENQIWEQQGVWQLHGAKKQSPCVFLSYQNGTACITTGPSLVGQAEIKEECFFLSVGLYPPLPFQTSYLSALKRQAQLEERFICHTPDSELDTQMKVLAAEIDGAWYPPRTMHSNESWNAPYLGWCNRFGNTLGGWPERVYQEVKYYCDRQHKSNDLQGEQSDAGLLLTQAAGNSRFYGLGHVDADQAFYNMQSQFFDQAIFAWRTTGDTRLEQLLEPALELHTCWQDQCFDPDGDGLYESYINTWPTDSVWYNGGGSCEETCYAYRAHQAAMELQNRKGNWKAAEKHRKILEKIHQGFFQLLWIKEGGYPAKKREKGGYERLHPDPWLYNCFLSVDVEITNSFDSVTALWYSKWALENVPQPGGGRTVWLSNWVPSIWSVRQNAAGENFQLAYGFFKGGLAEEGYQVLRGTIIRDGYCALQPGHICSEAASLLARAVICGLHGYRPDYPNGKVELCPQYPSSWEHADMKTHSFSSTYQRCGTTVRYTFQLVKSAQVTLKLPIYGEQLCQIKGADSWRMEPGFGCTLLILEMGQSSKGQIEVQTSGNWTQHPPLSFPASPGEVVRLSSDQILTLFDPQGMITKWEVEEGKVKLQFGQYSGRHLLFLSCLSGELPYYRIVEPTLSPTLQEQQAALLEQVEKEEHPIYHSLPMEQIFNGDVRTLFKQKYLSPRPKGIHLSIGSDGYSPWTFCYWGNNPPEIAFDSSLKSKGQLLYSREGVPFSFGGYEKNVAFTSLWDNWPAQITIPVQRNASAAYVLLLGTTNPMECNIANGILRFYYEDGSCDQVELVPPRNFWTLAPYTCAPNCQEQNTNNDYCYSTDGFCLPATPPETLSLGPNCRGIVLGCRLSKEKQLANVQLQTLSQEVVIGIAALTLRD